MISDIDKHRFEYIWHLYKTNKTDKDLPFEQHVPCDPRVWQFPESLVEYHNLVFEKGHTALAGKTVLDIGCGNAWYLGCLENIVKKYTGIDHVAKNITYARIMASIVDVDSTFIIDKAENVKTMADTIMMLSVTHHIPDVINLFDKFDCDNLILDSWEKLQGVDLLSVINCLESKGFDLYEKHEWNGSSTKNFGKRFILHLHRQAKENSVI
jgi:2-polyprenyl-3-methyl-5-hydroxy-6-metoxy-1,4-benzoquinol methylase